MGPRRDSARHRGKRGRAAPRSSVGDRRRVRRFRCNALDLMRVCLVTLGDPETLSGGYLFHRRLAELAPAREAKLTFFSFPERPFPFPIASGAQMVDATERADV